MSTLIDRENSTYRLCVNDKLNEQPNPILCLETRCDIVENIHRGSICCVEIQEDGSHGVIFSAGNIKQITYLRSALKFVQVLPLLESGAVEHFGLTEKEVAVMCASHISSPLHLDVVRGILTKIGCNESDLMCGGHPPLCTESVCHYLRQDHSANPFKSGIFNNCSGKHAGFLALCKYLNVPTDGHLLNTHPIQILIKEAACDIFALSSDDIHVGIDGCSAPTFAMPLLNAAIGYATLSSAEKITNPKRRQAVELMIRSITTFPEMVWGEKGFDTVLMHSSKGKVIGKRGAAGVFLSGIVGSGIGCAIKIDDGTMGPQYCVTVNFLRWLELRPRQGDLDVEEEVKEKLNRLFPSNMFEELLRFERVPIINCMGTNTGHLFNVPSLFQ